MADIETRLQAYRAEIDAIDVELIALLKKRTEIVSQVGRMKHEHLGDVPVIRPGREAIMTREIIKQDAGKFPRPMLAAIWRLLIAGSTSVEQPLTVCIYAEPKDREFFWLAHEYFGPVGIIHTQSTIGRVIGDVADGKARVGIIPLPDKDPDHWWRSLMYNQKDWPQIFGITPFLADNRLPSALMIGNIAPEETGDDTSIIVVESKGPLSRDKLHSVMEQAGYPANCLSQAPSDDVPGHIFYALCCAGFIPRQDTALNKIKAAFGDPVQAVYSLGCYANQLVVEEENEAAPYAHAS